MLVLCEECGKQIEPRDTATAVKECIIETPVSKGKVKVVMMTSCASGCICSKCRNEIAIEFFQKRGPLYA